MFVPKIKLLAAEILALPPIVEVALTTVFVEVTLKFDEEPVKFNVPKTLTRPAIMLIEPAIDKVLFRMTVPVLFVTPIVNPLPEVEDEID